VPAGTVTATGTTPRRTSHVCVTADFGGRMSSSAIRFDLLSDATPEAELEALAAVYAFLIQRHENHEATNGGRADIPGGESYRSKAPLGSGGPSATDRREEDSDESRERRKEVITQ
jgi:hypothetical protein